MNWGNYTLVSALVTIKLSFNSQTEYLPVLGLWRDVLAELLRTSHFIYWTDEQQIHPPPYTSIACIHLCSCHLLDTWFQTSPHVAVLFWLILLEPFLGMCLLCLSSPVKVPCEIVSFIGEAVLSILHIWMCKQILSNYLSIDCLHFVPLIDVKTFY